MNKVKRAYRIAYNTIENEEKLAHTIEKTKKHAEYIDEIALFVEFSHHGYWSISWIENRLTMLKKAMQAYRGLGIKRVGLNCLCTVGHLDEAWDFLEKPETGTVMSSDGESSRSCLCLNAPGFNTYIQEKYKRLASIHPDFIWVDDDIRIFNHRFNDVCYCPHCIEKFNLSYGYSFTREELAMLVKEGTEDCIQIVENWSTWRSEGYKNLGTVIEQAIHSVDPGIQIGLMTCSGMKTENRFEAFGAEMARPGGGFYDDKSPLNLVNKMYDIGLQNQFTPKSITDIQYEFENFPYEELAKSDTIRALECTASLAFGCNGIAFNAFGQDNDMGIMRVVSKYTSYWDRLYSVFKNKALKGVSFGLSRAAGKLACLGVPPAYNDAAVHVLGGKEALHLTDETILAFLSEGLFLDAEAFLILEKRGYGAFCGCKSGSFYTNGLCEQITNHPLNGDAAGFVRNPYMNFSGIPDHVCGLIASENAHVLSTFRTVTGIDTGVPCLTAYENSVGGKVAVSSFLPFEHIEYFKKREQLLSVLNWLSNDTLPVYIKTPARLMPVVLEDEHELSVMFVSMSFDMQKDICVRFPGKAGKSVSVLTENGPEPVGTLDHTETFIIPEIKPWSEQTYILF